MSSLSKVVTLAVRVPTLPSSHLLPYGDDQEADEVWQA